MKNDKDVLILKKEQLDRITIIPSDHLESGTMIVSRDLYHLIKQNTGLEKKNARNP